MCGVCLSVSISQNCVCVCVGGKKTEKKCFAHSYIPVKEFLDIKAGVMTVKVVSFYSRKGCQAHTSRAGVCLSFTASVSLLHAGAVRRLFLLWHS